MKTKRREEDKIDMAPGTPDRSGKRGDDGGSSSNSTMAAAAAPTGAGMAFFEGSVGLFDGDDKTYSSTKWAQDIEDNAEVFSWTPQQKLIIARRSLCGTAGMWLKSEKVFKSYEEMKAALQK